MLDGPWPPLCPADFLPRNLAVFLTSGDTQYIPHDIILFLSSFIMNAVLSKIPPPGFPANACVTVLMSFGDMIHSFIVGYPH